MVPSSIGIMSWLPVISATSDVLYSFFEYFLEFWKICRPFFPPFITITDVATFIEFPLETNTFAYHMNCYSRTILYHTKNFGLIFQLAACEEGEITSGFHHLVQTIMTYICALIELRVEDQTVAKFYRALTHKIYDLLDKVRLYSLNILSFYLVKVLSFHVMLEV